MLSFFRSYIYNVRSFLIIVGDKSNQMYLQVKCKY